MDYKLNDFEKKMEAALIEKKKALRIKISESNNEFKTKDEGSGKDSIDLASDDLISQRMEAISHHDTVQLQAVENALNRLYTGRYGKCFKCGNKIPESRLEAVPTAVFCINCQNASEKGNRH